MMRTRRALQQQREEGMRLITVIMISRPVCSYIQGSMASLDTITTNSSRVVGLLHCKQHSFYAEQLIDKLADKHTVQRHCCCVTPPSCAHQLSRQKQRVGESSRLAREDTCKMKTCCQQLLKMCTLRERARPTERESDPRRLILYCTVYCWLHVWCYVCIGLCGASVFCTVFMHTTCLVLF